MVADGGVRARWFSQSNIESIRSVQLAQAGAARAAGPRKPPYAETSVVLTLLVTLVLKAELVICG